MTGPEFRSLRLRMGVSLTQLAAILGVTVSTVCRYQSGAIVVPDGVVDRMFQIECPDCGHAWNRHTDGLCLECLAMPADTTAHASAWHTFG